MSIRREVQCVVEPLESRRLFAAAASVYAGVDGRLIHTPDADGDRILDFSAVGYRNGTALPSVAAKVTVSPGAGDDTARIQAAIDQVSALPVDADGFRGAVLLKAGEYQIATQIRITASGVVLRGEGSGTTGTVLRATGTGQRTLVEVRGSGSMAIDNATTRAVAETYVPVGAFSMRLTSTTGLSVGQRVVVRRPSTADWIKAIGMDKLAQPWTPGSKDLVFERTITRIEGSTITLDAPLANSLDQKYGGGTVSRYTWSGRITNSGVENLRGVSDYASSTDENHGWTFIRMDAIENGWVNNIVAQHFGYAAVHLGRGARNVTVSNSQCLDPISVITGSRRYSFNNDGQLNLFRNLYTRKGRHDYVQGATVPGPNVFVDSRADTAYSDTGPHHRWSAGALFDNITVNGNQINVQNRGNSGTGHGWAGANMVVYNSTATGGFIVQNPPTAQNWLIGSTGPLKTGTMAVGPRDPGRIESHGTRVDPRSLYYAQYADRNVVAGAQFREYRVGDIDNYTRTAADDVPVDAAWAAAVDAATSQPLRGFDVVAGNQYVPFTINFALGPTEQVYGATLSIGLKAGGGLPGNDVAMLDSTSNKVALSSLRGGAPGTAATARVVDLGNQLELLQDGRLNVCLSDDTAVDWAQLNLIVGPKRRTVSVSAVADTYVQDGAAANQSFGSSPSLVMKNSGPGYNRESFMRFNLTAVSGTILSASLQLMPRNVTDPVTIGVSGVADDTWSPATLTWNTRPAAGAVAATFAPVTGVQSRVNVTSLVQAARADNDLLSIKLHSLTKTANGYVDIASSEFTDAALRPVLVLTLA
jgi:hypothetical protein